MKIRDKLLIGFTVLIAITSVLGVVSVVQLNTMNGYYTELANVDSKAMELMQQMKLEVDIIIRDMFMYIDGETTGKKTDINESVQQFDDYYTEVRALLPAFADRLDELEDDHNLIVGYIIDPGTGVLVEQDSIWAQILNLLALHAELDGDIDVLLGMITDATMKLNVTEMGYYLAMQMFYVYEYISNPDDLTKSEFAAAEAGFDASVTNLTAFYDPVNDSVIYDAVIEMDADHAEFAGNVTDASVGIFSLKDSIEVKHIVIGDLLDELTNDLLLIDIDIEAEVDANKVGAAAAMSSALIITITMIVVAIVAGLAIAFPTIRSITKAIGGLVKTAEFIAKGDLTNEIEISKKVKSETDLLKNSFGVMQENLVKVISSTQTASINVANIATELAASSSEVNAASEEISSSTQEVAMTVQTQVKALTDISSMANEIQSLSHEVKSSGNDIDKVMEIIVGISEQTNLLALNASIEAGRAGEYGRGFAVVADEVRKLAEESKVSVETSSNKIAEILSRIDRTVELIGNITNDIQGTLAGLEQTSSAVEGISSSTEQQTASMEEVTSTANKLGSLAEELKSELEMFVIEQEGIRGQSREAKSRPRRFAEKKSSVEKEVVLINK